MNISQKSTAAHNCLFDNKLKSIMIQNGMTNKSLSEATNINIQTIYNTVVGNSVPGVDKAIDIARALNSTVELIFGTGKDIDLRKGEHADTNVSYNPSLGLLKTLLQSSVDEGYLSQSAYDTILSTLLNTPKEFQKKLEVFIEIPEAASILNLTPRSVRRNIKEGQLKAHKFGKSWKISEVDLNNFIYGEDA